MYTKFQSEIRVYYVAWTNYKAVECPSKLPPLPHQWRECPPLREWSRAAAERWWTACPGHSAVGWQQHRHTAEKEGIKLSSYSATDYFRNTSQYARKLINCFPSSDCRCVYVYTTTIIPHSRSAQIQTEMLQTGTYPVHHTVVPLAETLPIYKNTRAVSIRHNCMRNFGSTQMAC